MDNLLRTQTPAAAGFFMPSELQAHAGCWMAWPCRDAAHRGFVQEARRAYAAVARAIAEFEPVCVVARPQDAKGAAALLGEGVDVLPLPINDAWLRDSGPTFVVNNAGEVAGVDWLFNAWGGKYPPWSDDDAVAGALLRHLRLPRFVAPLVLEGGAIHADGEGTILTTRQCLLNANRNPRLAQAEVERLLCEYLGARRVVWLAGDARDTETDGHIDNLACFGEDNVVLFMKDDNNAMLRENRKLLQAARNAGGRPYNLAALPRPTVVENGEDLLASYINFYPANGGIVMPAFGVAQDETARAIVAELFPRRVVRQVAAVDIVRGGGGIHCITQQQPAGGGA